MVTVGLLAATTLFGVAAGALIVRPLVTSRPSILAPPIVGASVSHPAAAPVAAVRALPPQGPPVVASTPGPKPTAPRKLTAFSASSSHAVAPVAGSELARCGRLDRRERPACAHAVMLARDRSLRRAYARAVRAGVARDVLADTTRRWSGLRRQAVSQPARAAEGYADLSGELARQASAPPRGRGRTR